MPVDPLERAELDAVEALPRAEAADQLGLEQANLRTLPARCRRRRRRCRPRVRSGYRDGPVLGSIRAVGAVRHLEVHPLLDEAQQPADRFGVVERFRVSPDDVALETLIVS